MPAAERFTVEEKLAALHELREAVRVLLDDARERAAEGGAAGTGRGAELSRRDARSYEAQLAVLAEAEAALLAGRPRGIGARAGNLPVDGRHGAGPAGGEAGRGRAPLGGAPGRNGRALRTMPVLANPRWERFARHLFAGMSTAAAYAAAGYTPNRGNATRLKANEVVRARVRELNVRAAEEVAVTRGWILAALRRNVERAMQAEPVVDREGTPTGAYRYRGAVANRALELLGKEIGMFAARTINEHTGRDGQLFQVLTAAADAIGQLMAQLAAWKNGHAAVVEGEGEPGVAAPANREPGRGTAS